MNHDVGQTGDAPQTGWLIEVGQHRSSAMFAPEGTLLAITDQREDTIMAKQTRQHAACDVTATNDQEFLHRAILPD